MKLIEFTRDEDFGCDYSLRILRRKDRCLMAFYLGVSDFGYTPSLRFSMSPDSLAEFSLFIGRYFFEFGFITSIYE